MRLSLLYNLKLSTYLAFHGVQQLSFLIENGCVKAVVIIEYDNFSEIVDSDTNHIVSNSYNLRIH
jgi:hypothetical protein